MLISIYAKGKPKSLNSKVPRDEKVLLYYHLINTYLFTHLNMNNRTQDDSIIVK